MSVVSYVFFAFGWPVFLEMEIITGTLRWLGLLQPNYSEQFVEFLLFTACPLGAQFATLETATSLAEESRGAFYVAEIILFLATLLVALIVLALTLGTFDRCMGRMPERSPPAAARASAQGDLAQGAWAGERCASAGSGGDECLIVANAASTGCELIQAARNALPQAIDVHNRASQ